MGRARTVCLIAIAAVGLSALLVLATLFLDFPRIVREEPFPGGAYVARYYPSPDPGDEPPYMRIMVEPRIRSKENLLAYISHRQEALLEYVQLRDPEGIPGTVTFRYPLSMEEFRDFSNDFEIAKLRHYYVHRRNGYAIGLKFRSPLNTTAVINMLNDCRVLLVDPAIDLTIEEWRRWAREEERFGGPIWIGNPSPPIWDEYVKHVVLATLEH